MSVALFGMHSLFAHSFLQKGNIEMKYFTALFSTTFKTAAPKAERQHIHKKSEKNIKKDYLHQKGKSHSSTIWLDRQLRDPYYIKVF